MDQQMPSLARAVEAHTAGRVEEAEAQYRAILATSRSRGAAYNLGIICERAARHTEALSWFQAAVDAAPDDPDALSALGASLKRLQRPQEAEPLLRRSLTIKDSAETSWRLSAALLAMGRYEEGLARFEDRPARRNSPLLQARTPEWDGDPLAGQHILVCGEQGLGDQIQLARFVPMLRKIGAAKITLAVHPALVRLFSGVADEVIPRQGVLQMSRYDAWALIGSLPHKLGITLDDLPASPPYLRAAPVSSPHRVGIMTSANPVGFNGAVKTLPTDDAAQLLAHGFSLAPEDTGVRDMQDTADIIAGLDLVVTVDTSIAHLAGAMGKSVWILLPFVNLDWRWMLHRDDSPWYPGARLFRQPADGEWGGVVARVCSEMAALRRSPAPRKPG